MEGFEGDGAAAQEEGKRAGPWLWQGWPCSAASGEGGRRVNRLEGTRDEGAARELREVAEAVEALGDTGEIEGDLGEI